jgi:hypothetical protein
VVSDKNSRKKRGWEGVEGVGPKISHEKKYS